MFASLTAAALLAGAATTTLACETPAWRLVYRHDAEGRPMAGAKADLFAAIRRGDPVRIAWGMSVVARNGQRYSVEHSADPDFLTITGGSEVVVQIPEHIAQAGYAEEPGAVYGEPGVMWRGLFTTTGRFDAVWTDRGTGKEVRRMPQKAAIAWLAFAPDPSCDSRKPLDLAIPGGVALREAPKP